jgi:hypothetical protein
MKNIAMFAISECEVLRSGMKVAFLVVKTLLSFLLTG